jgi:tRNA-(ms[2]io[6]A)-hydroxylase
MKLDRERKDDYVNELHLYMKSVTGVESLVLVERLLFSAMIEARSCERFKVLSENIQDEELSVFYRDLMESEVITTFISYARNMEPNRCRKRWREWIEYEASLLQIMARATRFMGNI